MPVIVIEIMITETPATVLLIRNDDEICEAACCIAARNNEMIPLIAKYFFRFLHELTVSSFSVTIVTTSLFNANIAHGEKEEISARVSG